MPPSKRDSLSFYSYIAPHGSLWGPFCEFCMQGWYRNHVLPSDITVFCHSGSEGVPFTLADLVTKNGSQKPFFNSNREEVTTPPPVCTSATCKIREEAKTTVDCEVQATVVTKEKTVNTDKGRGKNRETQTSPTENQVKKVSPAPQHQQTQTIPTTVNVPTPKPTGSEIVAEKQKLVVSPLVHNYSIPFFRATNKLPDAIKSSLVTTLSPKWRLTFENSKPQLKVLLKQMNVQIEPCLICKVNNADEISMLGHALSASHLSKQSSKGCMFSKRGDLGRLDELFSKIELKTNIADHKTEKPSSSPAVIAGPSQQTLPKEKKPNTVSDKILRIPFSSTITGVMDPIQSSDLMAMRGRWKDRFVACKLELQKVMKNEGLQLQAAKCTLCNVKNDSTVSALDHSLSASHLNTLSQAGWKFSKKNDADRLEDLLTKAEAMMPKQKPAIIKQVSSVVSTAKKAAQSAAVKKITTTVPVLEHPFLSGRNEASDALSGVELDAILKAFAHELWELFATKVNGSYAQFTFCWICEKSFSSYYCAIEHILSFKHIFKVEETGRVFSRSLDEQGLRRIFDKLKEVSPVVPTVVAQSDVVHPEAMVPKLSVASSSIRPQGVSDLKSTGKPAAHLMYDHFHLPLSQLSNDPRLDNDLFSVMTRIQLRGLARTTDMVAMKDICKYARSFSGCPPMCHQCNVHLDCACALFIHIFSDSHLKAVGMIKGWLYLLDLTIQEANRNGFWCEYDEKLAWKGIPFDPFTNTGEVMTTTQEDTAQEEESKCVIS